MSYAVALALAAWLSVFPTRAEAQTGDNGVYNYLGTTVVNSPAFIDAKVFTTKPPSNDLCSVLNYMLTPSHGIVLSYGAVIDARGLPAAGTSMTCPSSQPSPWSGIINPPPSTILLPATTGSNPIVIPLTWSLPPNTHLIGEGDSILPTGLTLGTTLVAQSSFTAGTPMISFGLSSLCTSGCTGISVENLTLNGQGQYINGIANGLSQDSSYVDHVSLYRILGTGLSVSGNANNSGPYSNITFNLGSDSGTSSTICASINGLSGTRGIHGLTCISANNDPPAAILLDSSNNSIEDVSIVGFYDGIRVGANANAQSNVLVNIIGDTTPAGAPTPINVIHITNLHTVSDLSIMGANNAGGSSGTVTVQDDLTLATIKDTSVGIYALGNKETGNYYSRFTTSPTVATWVVGPQVPAVGCALGSLYSCIGNSSGSGTNCASGTTQYALWACAYNSSGSIVWRPVI